MSSDAWNELYAELAIVSWAKMLLKTGMPSDGQPVPAEGDRIAIGRGVLVEVPQGDVGWIRARHRRCRMADASDTCRDLVRLE